jgi:hypothetical protein
MHERDRALIQSIQDFFGGIGAKWCGMSLLCLQLSNSGDLLKLLIPSNIWKNICGWTNYSCMVISQKMIEREMEYRGSKSDFNLKSVKEQRVDGSWQGAGASCLRCTLMGFSGNYRVRIPSNQINRHTIRYYSSKPVQQSVPVNPNLGMNPWFLTGFVDAEGCFTLGITRNKECKTGWSVQLFFSIALHRKDKDILDQIQNYFGVGKIYKHGPQSLLLRVLSIKDLPLPGGGALRPGDYKPFW